MKVKAFIASIACILIVGVIAILLYCFWPAITGTINDNKYYTAEELQEAYDKGYNDGCKTETELNGQVEYYKQLVDEYYIQVNTLNDEIATLNDGLRQKDEQILSLTSTKNSLETEMSSLQNAIKEKEKTIEENNQEITSLNKQIEEISDSDNGKTQEIQKLKQQVEEMTETNKQLQSTIDSHLIDIALLNSQVSSLNNQITELGEQIDDYKSQIASINTQIATLNDTIENYKKEIEGYKKVIEELKKLNACVVTFSVDGQIISTQQVNKTESPSHVDVPLSDKYVFDGWTIAGSSELVDPFSYSVVEDMQFVAKIRKYKVITFTIDGSVISTQKIVEDSELKLPDTPQKEHYNCSASKPLFKLIIGSKVEQIPKYLFAFCSSYRTNIGSIEFEEGSVCSKIGSYAFATLSGADLMPLEEIELPESLTIIDDYAFYNCQYVSKIYFNVTEMKDLSGFLPTFTNSRFYKIGKKVGTEVIIGNNVKRVPGGIFMRYGNGLLEDETSNITKVSFASNSVCEEIGDYAFHGCVNLTDVEIPFSITTIGTATFRYCKSLNYATYSNGKYLGNVNNPYYYLITYADVNATDYSVHSSTRYINRSSINSRVENLTIEGVNTDFISEDGVCDYHKLNSLKTINVNPDNLYYTVYENVLYNKDKSVLLMFPSNDYAEDGNTKSFVIPDFVTTIGGYAFERCWNLKELFIPSSVILIEEHAFSDNQRLKTIIIESAYAYNNVPTLLSYATTVKVLKTIVDDEANTNEKLSDTSKYTKTSEENYYIFTKVS